VVRQAQGAAAVVVGSLSGVATRSSRQRSQPCSAAIAAQEPRRWCFHHFRRRRLLARSGQPVSAARQGRLRVVDDDGGLGSVLRSFCCLARSGDVLGPAKGFACVWDLGRSLLAITMTFVAWSFAGPRRPRCGRLDREGSCAESRELADAFAGLSALPTSSRQLFRGLRFAAIWRRPSQQLRRPRSKTATPSSGLWPRFCAQIPGAE